MGRCRGAMTETSQFPQTQFATLILHAPSHTVLVFLSLICAVSQPVSVSSLTIACAHFIQKHPSLSFKTKDILISVSVSFDVHLQWLVNAELLSTKILQ